MKYFKLLIFFIIYKLSLDYIYLNSISKHYGYLGYVNEFNHTINSLSYVVLALYAYFFKKILEKNTPASLILMVTFLLYFLPNLTFCIHTDNLDFFIYSVLYCIIFFFCYIRYKNVKYYKIFDNSQSMILFKILLYTVVLLMLVFSVIYNGFNIKFDFEEVYEIRAKVSELNMPSFINYLRPIASMFITISFMYYLLQKNVFLSCLFFFFGLMMYSFGAHKTDFVLLIMTILIYFFYRKEYDKYLLHVFICLNLILIFFIEFGSETVQISIAGLYSRTFFTPTLLAYFHYDYFSTHELLYLREHFGHWFESTVNHKNNSPYIIAATYFNDPEMSSNTGLIGSDYAQFGWASLLVFPVVRAFFLRVFDMSSFKLDARIYLISSFSFGILFINGAFFTALISGGFLAVCFLLYLMPRYKKNNE
jgi:hypothetical protein